MAGYRQSPPWLSRPLRVHFRCTTRYPVDRSWWSARPLRVHFRCTTRYSLDRSWRSARPLRVHLGTAPIAPQVHDEVSIEAHQSALEGRCGAHRCLDEHPSAALVGHCEEIDNTAHIIRAYCVRYSSFRQGMRPRPILLRAISMSLRAIGSPRPPPVHPRISWTLHRIR